jgi:acetyl-CoA C-acetyltransferase
MVANPLVNQGAAVLLTSLARTRAAGVPDYRLIHLHGGVELYSCFPCVPKMPRRVLGLAPEVVPSVTGGLTFFGAPLNNYMAHAAVAMVRRLREAPGLGLLYS